ncbi:hypothetical protein ACFZAE_08770 [Streptomyces scabiei]|uniref:hypothetical protein n=1 Tax=Streptomyces scabiei TaxID=1930 RepID=UPI0036E8212D
MSRRAVVLEKELPLRIERPFLLWSYEVSHRRLVLRSRPGAGATGGAVGGAVEVEFLNVLGMKVKSQYSQLLISPAPAPGTAAAVDIDAFVSVPDRHRSKITTLLVSDGAEDGFVICGALRVRES